MEEGARRLGIELIHQYPAKEQAELKVRITIPGAWFGGALTADERSVKYWAQAKGSAEAHSFKKQGSRKEQTCAAIQFLCESDVVDDPTHAGFWMALTDWNRYRHDTYKHNREAELVYIRSPDAAAPAADAPAAAVAPSKASIYSEYKLVDTGRHTQKCKDGKEKQVKCEYFKCIKSSGKCKSQNHVFKVINSGTMKIRTHLRVCNPARYLEICGAAPRPCASQSRASRLCSARIAPHCSPCKSPDERAARVV